MENKNITPAEINIPTVKSNKDGKRHHDNKPQRPVDTRTEYDKVCGKLKCVGDVISLTEPIWEYEGKKRKMVGCEHRAAILAAIVRNGDSARYVVITADKNVELLDANTRFTDVTKAKAYSIAYERNKGIDKDGQPMSEPEFDSVMAHKIADMNVVQFLIDNQPSVIIDRFNEVVFDEEQPVWELVEVAKFLTETEEEQPKPRKGKKNRK